MVRSVTSTPDDVHSATAKLKVMTPLLESAAITSVSAGAMSAATSLGSAVRKPLTAANPSAVRPSCPAMAASRMTKGNRVTRLR